MAYNVEYKKHIPTTKISDVIGEINMLNLFKIFFSP